MGIRIWEIKKHPPKDASYSELCIRLGHYNPSDMNFKQGTRGSLVSMLRYDSADIMRVEISSSIKRWSFFPFIRLCKDALEWRCMAHVFREKDTP